MTATRNDTAGAGLSDQRYRRKARLFLPGILLMLTACSPSPDLGSLEAGFDAPPDEREVRVDAEVSETRFGRSVASAVETNPRFDASNADVLAARAREDGEAGAFLPRFSLGVTLGSGLSGGSMALSPILELI